MDFSAPSSEPRLDGGYALMLRMRLNRLTEADLERLAQLSETWHKSEAAISFDRLLGLRGRTASWHIGERDVWLARALRLMSARCDWPACSALERKWIQFLAAGPWRLWRGDDEPPAGASELERALFFASRHNKGNSIGARQIYRRIAVDIFGHGDVNGSPVP